MSLKNQIIQKQEELQQDASENLEKEMPLTLRIEKYQRQKLMDGVKPTKDAVQIENFKYLQSLKFIQRFEEDVEEANELLRTRTFEEFKKDPLGKEYIEKLEKDKNMH